MKRTFTPLLLSFLVLLVTGCADSVGVNSANEASPAALQATTEAEYSRAAGQQELTIAETALAVNAESGEFSILIDALQRADLVSALDQKRQLTVFAPTDAAFVELLDYLGPDFNSLDDVVDALGTDGLASILLYHVVPGRRYADTVLKQKQLNTLNGAFLTVDAESGALIDAGERAAPIIDTDIEASNGVIHVISEVVLPPL